LAVFIPNSKKKKRVLSRIPHADVGINPYIIRPYTHNLNALLDAQLNELLNSEPICLDGQNGDVLDNLIDCWKKRAVNNLEKQRASHIDHIEDLTCSIEANLENAKKWLEIDEKDLITLEKELQDLYEELYKQQKEMRYW